MECLTSTESQTAYMLGEGNPAARAAVFDDPAIQEKFPMAGLIRDSINGAGLRPQTPFYPDVSSAVQRTYSPPRDVDPATTPADADQMVEDVLQNRALV